MNYCKDCNIKITRQAVRCGSCAALNIQKINKHPRYIDGRTKKVYYCKDCCTPISITAGIYGSGKCKCCTLKGKPLSDRHKKLVCLNLKNGEACKGSKNSQWRGGISFELYPVSFSKKLKAEIRKRDNYTCQICGKSEQDEHRNLSIHHIDYDKTNSSESNLISLCDSCHQKTNFNHLNWTKYFKECLYVNT